MKDALAELKTAHAAAIEGQEENEYAVGHTGIGANDHYVYCTRNGSHPCGYGVMDKENATFIAACFNHVGALLEEVERLRTEVATLKERGKG